MRIGDPRQKCENFLPYPFLVALVIGPEAVLNCAFPSANPDTDQVEEISVWKSFDIEIDRRTVEFKLAEIDRMDPVFAYRKRSQRMMIFLAATMHAPRPPTRAERVGQLSYCKNTFLMELLAFISGHATEEAEFLFLLGLRATPCLILALPAMSVQHKVDRC